MLGRHEAYQREALAYELRAHNYVVNRTLATAVHAYHRVVALPRGVDTGHRAAPRYAPMSTAQMAAVVRELKALY